MQHLFHRKTTRLLSTLVCVWFITAASWARPVLTGLAPASGPVGTAVTITGTGFSATAAQNVVYFEAVRATVTSASATELRVLVPAGATSAARVTVVNTANQQQGSTKIDGLAPFRVTFAGSGLSANSYRQVGVGLGLTGNSSFPLPDTNRLTAADFNEDGYLDILALNTGLLLALGDGTGSFQTPVAIPAGFRPSSALARDFTGDGKLDIVTVNPLTNDINLLAGQAGGGFVAAQSVYTNTTPGRTLADVGAVEDVDGDGRLDLLLNFSSGFSATNNDHLWLVNAGGGSFTPVAIPTVNSFYIQAAEDFTGDGKLDLVGVSSNGTTLTPPVLTIWPRNAANTGYAAPENLTLVTNQPVGRFLTLVGDLNADNRPDVWLLPLTSTPTQSQQPNAWAYLRNATGTGFTSVSTSLLVSNSNSPDAILADADGDGSLDVVVNSLTRLNLWLNNGAGTAFQEIPTSINSNGVSRVISADVNGDGRLDFITANAPVSFPGPLDGTVYLNTNASPGQNNPPTLNALASLTIDEDGGLYTVPLSGISNGGEAGQGVTVTARSSDASLLPNPTVSYFSPGSTATLRLQPAPDAFGTVTVTVTVSDGQAQNGTVTRSFQVTINPVNDPPTLDPIPDIVLTSFTQFLTVPLSGITSGAANENQSLRVSSTAASNCLGSGIVTYTSPATSGTVRVCLGSVINPTGLLSTVTITVDDGQPTNNTISRSFRVFLQPSGAGTSPTLDPIADVTANRTLATQLPVALTGIDDGDPTQVLPLTVTAVSSDPALVSISAIGYTSPATSGSLQYAISATRGGTVTVTVTVSNGNGPTSNVVRSFRVTVPQPITTGTTAAVALGLRLYPNPSPGGRFTLETDASAGPATLALYDLLGREVWRQQLPTLPKQLTARPAKLQAGGVYVLRLTTAQGTVSRRLVVE